ncbi:MAG: T9SS type A sorting domain-containing protein [Bacteroidales bacterium]|nr:T9SS type A sorting domain-containing protein [Bacteroidales bacterium]
MKKLVTLFFVIFIAGLGYSQEVITQWTFDTDGVLGSDNGVGQEAQLIGGTTEVSQDDALRVTNFPDQFENSGTAGIELMLSTEGYEHIMMEYMGRTSGTMSRWAEIHYTLDGGTEWHLLQDNDGGLYPRDEWHEFAFDFSAVSGANDNPDFGIRIVSVFAPVDFDDGLGNEFDAHTAYQRSRDSGGDPYSGAGNWRFQDVVVKGQIKPDLTPITHWSFSVDGDLSSDNGVGQEAQLIGGTTEVSQDDALRVTNFPDQFENSGTAGIELMLSTAGFEHIIMEYDGRTSGTMSRWAEIHYTLDGGTSWHVLQDNDGGLYPRDEWHEFAFDFSAVSGASDNPDFGIRIVSVFAPVDFDDGLGNEFDAHTAYQRSRDAGGDPYSGAGNWRFRNVSFLGVVLTGQEAEKLAVVSINDNETVYVDEPFSVTINVLDADDMPAAVVTNTFVTLSLEDGVGTLSGTLAGIIQEGAHSVVISGILYDAVDSNVVIKAEAEGLDFALSEAFDVVKRTYALALSANIPGAGILTGDGEYYEGEEVTIMAEANEGYEFVNWTLDGAVFATEAQHTFAMPAGSLSLVANFEEEYTGGPVLVHYWHFNTMTGATVTEVAPDYSVAGLSALITYPGEGDGYMDARTHRPADPVSNFNLRLGQEPDQGAVLRVRNPADTRELLFEIPSTGYRDLVVTYAVTRSDNGGQYQRFEYSADGGDTWVTVGEDIEVPFIGEGEDVGIYAHVVIDLSSIDEVNNNPDLYFRILSVGEGSENTSGNQRFDNITLDAVPMIVGEPELLNIVSINDGEPVYVGEAFSMLVQTVDGEHIPVPVEEDVAITLSLETGSGNLGGTLSGVIEAGNSSVVIEGITYDLVENGVVIKAEAEGLDAAFSSAFDVIARTWVLTLESFPPGAGVLIGAGEFEEGTDVNVLAEANEGFAFTHWSMNDEEISTEAAFVFNMPGEDVTLTANFTMLGDVLLIHYWHFNNQEINVEEDYLVMSDFSLVGQGEITYPGEGPGYVDFRTHREADPVSNFNLRLGEEPDQGAVLRVRNPSHTRELIITAPSTGFAELVVMFATTRTENGNQEQEFYFSPDAGENWTLVEEAYYIPSLPEDEGYVEKVFDLSGYEEVNDNPDLRFKVLFVGEGNDNDSGNNRFDNITVDGRSLGDDVSVEELFHAEPLMLVYPNPARDIFHIRTEESDMIIRIYNLQGQMVFQRQMTGAAMTIDASQFRTGMYIIRGESATGNNVVSKRLMIR